MSKLTARLRAAAGAATAVGYSQLHPDGTRPRAATWPVPEAFRAAVQIRWPRQYEWAPAEKWVGGLRRALAADVPVRLDAIDQPYEGVVLIVVEIEGTAHQVAIDYFDGERLLDEVADRCALVFKMQYAWEGYGADHVVPGGYVPGQPHIYRYLPGLRHLRDTRPARFEAYGRFGAAYATETRRTAIEHLTTQNRFRFEGTLAIRPYSAYLKEAARSMVCIDLPGNGDLCHRLIDYLAVGCCVVRPALRTRLHVDLVHGEHICFSPDAAEGLVGACAGLIADAGARDHMSRAGREYFDRYLRIEQLAGYYLDRCAKVLMT